MKNGIILGAALGMVIGALLVNNNTRVRNMVSDTQERVKNKAMQAKDSMMKKDDCCCQSAEQNAQSENMQSDYMN